MLKGRITCCTFMYYICISYFKRLVYIDGKLHNYIKRKQYCLPEVDGQEADVSSSIVAPSLMEG